MDFRKIKWWKVVLMLALTAFFFYCTAGTVPMVRRAYSNWIVNRLNVQERMYEALGDLFGMTMILIMIATCFIASLRSLIHCFFPLKEPSVFARLAIRHGGWPALISFIIFLVLLAFEMVLRNIIENTPELSEVPATLGEQKLGGWIGIALVLAFEATIVMFVSWLQNRFKRKEK